MTDRDEWEMTSVREDEREQRDRLLSEGWEPFSITVEHVGTYQCAINRTHFRRRGGPQ